MAKKGLGAGSMVCPGCGKSTCCCPGGWCMVLCGLVVAIAGVLMVWPQGWFTPWRTLGIVFFLFGLKMLFWGFKR